MISVYQVCEELEMSAQFLQVLPSNTLTQVSRAQEDTFTAGR